MPGAAGVCGHSGTAGCRQSAVVRAPGRTRAGQASSCRRAPLPCRGSREPFDANSETNSVPYFLKSKVASLRQELQDYYNTLTRQADSITSVFTPSSEDDARDMILMSVSFVALVWLSMELVRLYLFWYEEAGLKTIAQLLHDM